MKWAKQTFYNIKNGEFSICEVKVKELTSFELFEKQKVLKQGFTSIKEAIKYFNELKNGELK